ncbi:MAG: Peptidyl-prolyl cis-trans isomerase cyp6 [Bathelium mastoideum]|nr:MAG: Peptidyl-prolyl cis-trans isomerase cyp6 [Bathelium mastoideum]
MAVMLETSLGDIVVDLFPEQAPKCSQNFLKLCKAKYYNFSPFYNVQPNVSCQTGDPIGPDSSESDGGSSIWGLLGGSSDKLFRPEIHPKLRHTRRGTVSMATTPAANDPDDRLAGSQFLITLGDDVDRLDGKAAIFGIVAEGFDVLERINSSFLDMDTGKPLKDIRLLHTRVIDDPYPDPPDLQEPPESPMPTPAQLATQRIAYNEDLDENVDQESLEKLRREREARAQALTLEMVGDLPFAEVKPPENVLFVCKLNPVTRDEDLELLFSRFGKILSCEVIRDKKTGDSLQYAFIEFENQEDCERAYTKMDNVLIDDHRIHVDFSQSVSKIANVWRDSTNSKRARQGGFGGVADLEKRKQYRAESGRDWNRKNGYDMSVPDGYRKKTSGVSVRTDIVIPTENAKAPEGMITMMITTIGQGREIGVAMEDTRVVIAIGVEVEVQEERIARAVDGKPANGYG